MIPYEETMDRETVNYIYRRLAEGPYFGMITSDSSYLRKELKRRGVDIHERQGSIFFSGRLADHPDLERVLEGVTVHKVVKASYAYFPETPDLLWDALVQA